LTLAIVGRERGQISRSTGWWSANAYCPTATPAYAQIWSGDGQRGRIPLKLMDTAGIRHSTDEAASIGIS